MSRLELPTTQAEMQELIDEYGPTAVTIGLNQIRTKHLESFADEYVSDGCEPLSFEVNGKQELYTQRLTSGVTLGGMMIHTRLHRLPHSVDQSKQYIIVAESLYDSEPEKYWFAGSTERTFPGAAAHQTDVTASAFAGFGYGRLQLVGNESEHVEQPDQLHDPSTEDLLESALVQLGLPQLSFGDGGWRFRVGPGMYDDVQRMQEVRGAVAKLRGALAVTPSLPADEQKDSQLAPTGSDQ